MIGKEIRPFFIVSGHKVRTTIMFSIIKVFYNNQHGLISIQTGILNLKHFSTQTGVLNLKEFVQQSSKREKQTTCIAYLIDIELNN